MIVVIGIPAWRPADPPRDGAATGLAVDIARAAALSGARVELVGKAGEDPAGAALMLDLARSGIGHAALLRDPGRATRSAPVPGPAGPLDEPALEPGPGPLLALEADDAPRARSNGRSAPPASEPRLALEPADLELALRYLVDFRVLVIAEDLSIAAAAVVSDAAGFAGAHVVAATEPSLASALPADSTVFEPPADDSDGEFARLVAGYAVALDQGEAPEPAFRGAVAERGWEPAG
jgi:hypothetical protein